MPCLPAPPPSPVLLGKAEVERSSRKAEGGQKVAEGRVRRGGEVEVKG